MRCENPRRLPAAAALLAALLLGAGTAWGDWRPDRFLISGWFTGGLPDGPRLQAMNDAGIDLVLNGDRWDVLEVDRTVQVLDSLAAAHPNFRLRAVLDYRNQVDSYSFHRAARAHRVPLHRRLESEARSSRVAGWMLWDEPVDERDFRDLAELLAVVGESPAARDRIPFVNLYPLHAAAQPAFAAAWGSDPVAAYDRYLECYFAAWSSRGQVAPFVCFDVYPFETGSLRTDLFLNLSRVQLAAARAASPRPVPIWVVVQLSPSRKPGGPWRPTPDMARIRWQVSTALAYGAKGIVYFTLVPSERSNFGAGLMDARNKRDKRYDSLRSYNLALHRVGRLLMDLDPVSVTHAAALGQRGLENDLVESPRRTDRFVHTIAGNDGMVGHLREPATGRDHLVVVNKSVSASRTLTVTLSRTPSRIERYSPAKDRWSEAARNSSSVVLKGVAPGEAVLCRIID